MTSLRERLPDRPVSETFETEGARRRYCAAVRKFAEGRIANIFPEDHKAGSDAHTAATIFDTEVASHGAKNGSPVRDPEKGVLPRDTGLRAHPRAVCGARRVSAGDSLASRCRSAPGSDVPSQSVIDGETASRRAPRTALRLVTLIRDGVRGLYPRSWCSGGAMSADSIGKENTPA